MPRAIAGSSQPSLYYLKAFSASGAFNYDTLAACPAHAFWGAVFLLVAPALFPISWGEHLAAMCADAIRYPNTVKIAFLRTVNSWLSSSVIYDREVLTTLWAGSCGRIMSLIGICANAATELAILTLERVKLGSTVQAFGRYMTAFVEAFLGAILAESAVERHIELFSAVRTDFSNSWLASISHGLPFQKELPADLGTALLSRQHSDQREAESHYGVPVCVA